MNHPDCRHCGRTIRSIPVRLADGTVGSEWRHRTDDGDGHIIYRDRCLASTVAEP